MNISELLVTQIKEKLRYKLFFPELLDHERFGWSNWKCGLVLIGPLCSLGHLATRTCPRA